MPKTIKTPNTQTNDDGSNAVRRWWRANLPMFARPTNCYDCKTPLTPVTTYRNGIRLVDMVCPRCGQTCG